VGVPQPRALNPLLASLLVKGRLPDSRPFASSQSRFGMNPSAKTGHCRRAHGHSPRTLMVGAAESAPQSAEWIGSQDASTT
jgi:hypothetical protein